MKIRSILSTKITALHGKMKSQNLQGDLKNLNLKILTSKPSKLSRKNAH